MSSQFDSELATDSGSSRNSSAMSAATATAAAAAAAASARFEWPLLGLLAIPVCTVWGNALVCVSVFVERRLQNRFNFFLVSLAISDLLCALLVMPVSAWNMVHSGQLSRGPRGVCLAWYSLDVFFTSTTIIHLCSISLDRYLVLSNPLKYHRAEARSSLPVKIGTAWLVPFCIACPLFILAVHLDDSGGPARSPPTVSPPAISYPAVSQPALASDSSYKGCGPHNAYFIVIATAVTFVVPLVIMLVTYVLTVCSIIRQTSQARHNLYPGRSAAGLGGAKPTPLARVTDDSQSLNDTSNSAENVSYSLLAVDERCCSHSSLSLSSCGGPLSPPPNPPRSGLRVDLETHLNVPTVDGRRSFDFSRECRRPLHKQSSLTDHGRTGACPSSTGALACSTSALACSSGALAWTGRSGTAADGGLLGANKQSRNSAKRTLAAMNSGKKAVQVLGILFGLFLLCYLPFFVIYLVDFFCGRCQATTGPLVSKTEWIGYSASMLNPIVYHVFNPTFRNTFNRLMRGQCYKVRKAFSSSAKALV